METVATIGLVLLVLACPLSMVGIGVGAWLIGRARGQKKELSVGCMLGHGERNEQSEDGALKEHVAKLEKEIESLQAQSGRSQP
jgi:hypothetical protein